MQGYTILVVDDRPELLRLLSTYLPRHGHKVSCAGSGEEALASLRAEGAAFHLVVLDLGLPDMDGREVAEIILNENPDIRLLIASGAAFEIESLGAARAARTLFLQKPYVPTALTEAIQRLMNSGPGID